MCVGPTTPSDATAASLRAYCAVITDVGTLGTLPRLQRRLSIIVLLLAAAATIFAAAEPFAEGLVHSGVQLGIDEFLLVQWLAPLASEAPEFLFAGILAYRGRAGVAMGALLSSKVNQWTLLIGGLPLAYSLSGGHLEGLLEQRFNLLPAFRG